MPLCTKGDHPNTPVSENPFGLNYALDVPNNLPFDLHNRL
jgi:hypothetical protein